MSKAIIDILAEQEKIVALTKAEYGFKNKNDAINFIIKKFKETVLEADNQIVNSFNEVNPDDKWMLGEEIPDMDFSFSQIWISCFSREFAKYTGKTYNKALGIYKGYHLWFYFGEKDSNEVAQNILDKFLTQKDFMNKTNQEIIKVADKLRGFVDNISKKELSKLSGSEVAEIYEEYDRIHTEYYSWAWIPVAVDMFHNNLTNTLKEYLKSKGLNQKKVNEYFITLSQPIGKSLIQIEEEEFLNIAKDVQSNKIQEKLFKDLYKKFQEQDAAPYGLATHTKEFEEKLSFRIAEIENKIEIKTLRRLREHYKKNYYVKFLWVGKDGVNSFEHYLRKLVKFVGQGADANGLLKKIDLEYKNHQEKKKEIIKEIQLEEKWKNIFENFGDFMVTKIYRRYAQIYAIYKMQSIFKEIAKRCELSLKQVRFMMTREVRPALVDNDVNKKELQKRTNLAVIYTDSNTETVITGVEAQEIAKRIQNVKIENITQLKGQSACIGKATGIVKIIIRPSDMVKMNEGDILVSIATDPDIISAMKKAAAFVTEQGGVTSHAAIVAREMNKPCVIGTKIATKVLKDGDLVEVDAEIGVVNILKRA